MVATTRKDLSCLQPPFQPALAMVWDGAGRKTLGKRLGPASVLGGSRRPSWERCNIRMGLLRGFSSPPTKRASSPGPKEHPPSTAASRTLQVRPAPSLLWAGLEGGLGCREAPPPASGEGRRGWDRPRRLGAAHLSLALQPQGPGVGPEHPPAPQPMGVPGGLRSSCPAPAASRPVWRAWAAA